jgi:hypothetical protein
MVVCRLQSASALAGAEENAHEALVWDAAKALIAQGSEEGKSRRPTPAEIPAF